MDAKTIRLRLEPHGDLTAHRDGSFTLSLRRPVGEYWRERLLRAVREEVPGARVRLIKCRPAADRFSEFHEVLFTLGPGPESAPSLITPGSKREVPREVAKAERAVIPAHLSESPGRRPGSGEGPGRVSPAGLVGRESGRAA